MCVCVRLFVIPWTLAPPGPSVHGLFRARTLEWVAISYSRDPPDSVIEPTYLASPALASEVFAAVLLAKANLVAKIRINVEKECHRCGYQEYGK